MSFGDVNLSEDSVRGPPHNPGSGGWPTIRYFNKDTGVEGGNYEKKTDKSMCDELGGDGSMLEAYVEDAGKTSLCSVSTGKGCSDKETAYIEKMKAKGPDDHAAQLQRLESMEGGSMKPELLSWLKKRKKILGQLVKAHEEL